MPVFWLDPDNFEFPPPDRAFPDGLLAVGGDLSLHRLLNAYKNGIFPWYNPQDPILWWSPDPRLVLFPNEIKISKSMRVYFNRPVFKVTYNREFEKVMRTCGEISRRNQQGSWIHEEMIEAYVKLHEEGYAHSVEVWQDNELIGGLYGVAFGKIFFGESMFAFRSNASKFGFIKLVQRLQQLEFMLIDCQQETPHLQSLGAVSVSRKYFIEILNDSFEKFDFKPLILS